MADETLNLDDLFGNPQPVNVRWQEIEYHFARMETLTPRQIAQLNKLQKQAREVSGNDDPDVERVDTLLNDMLTMLCAEFPAAAVPFALKTRVMEFYAAQAQPQKKMMTPAQTGATSSQDSDSGMA